MGRLPKDTEDNGLSKAFLALAKRAAYQSLEDFYKTLEEHDVTLRESVQRICIVPKRMENSGLISLYEESWYLRGARQLLIVLNQSGCGLSIEKGKGSDVYNKAILDELLHNRESLAKFLQGASWRYYGHESDKKGKLVKVKIKFE